jgi:5-methylcytosine-specific restriction endonuclease McrA
MLPHQEKILSFDPKPIYDIINVDRFSRIQSIPIGKMFPENGKLCGCGCGTELKGRRKRWATDSCMRFAQAVWGIINGHSEIISFYLKLIHKHWACCNCGEVDKYTVYKNGVVVSAIHKDHIVAVKNGGGGCWLDNYQLLCDCCHKEKTKQD